MKETPQAFPIIGGTAEYHYGMTLRDYFAAKAIAPNLTAIGSANWKTPEECANHVAMISYIMADAMLAEREK